MPETIHMRRRGHALHAASEWDGELLAKLPEGADLKAVVSQPRSVPQNAFYWVGLQQIVDNLPEHLESKYPTKRHLHQAFLVATGHVTTLYRIYGTEVLIPDSTSFDQMQPSDFRAYFDKVQRKSMEWLGWSPWAGDEP